MSIRDELLALMDADPDRMLHPRRIVEWARTHHGSALYKAIEWDDEKAAEEYRLSQVRSLIKMHVITDEHEPQMVSLSFDRAKGGGYRDIDDVLQDRDLSKIMLRDALDDLQRVQKRYERVAELTSVWVSVEDIRRRIKKPKAQQPEGRS